MDKKKGKSGRKLLKVEKSTLRNLDTSELSQARGGLIGGDTSLFKTLDCPYNTLPRTANHNQRLLRHA